MQDTIRGIDDNVKREVILKSAIEQAQIQHTKYINLLRNDTDSFKSVMIGPNFRIKKKIQEQELLPIAPDIKIVI